MNSVCSRFRHLHIVHGLSNLLAKFLFRLTVVLCGVPRLLPSLCRVLTIERVSLIGFLFGIFHSSSYISPDFRWRNSSQQVQVFYIGWLQASCDGSACTVLLWVQFLGSVSGHEMISPRLVLCTQPQNSIMPMLLFLWYLRLLPISNWTTFFVDCSGWPPSSFYCVCAPCSLACDQD